MAITTSKIFKKSKRRNLITYTFPESKVSDEFRKIRTNVDFITAEQKHKVLLVTSPNSGEGKTTTAANLAVSIAQQNKKALLIDANFRQPAVHFVFKIENLVGLTDVLLDKSTFEEAVIRTEMGNLEVLPSGMVPANSTELLASHMMKELLEKVAKEYDVVIIDSSSLLEVTDTNLLANLCDGVILVLFQGKTQLEKAAEAKKILEFSKARIAGVVLNEI